MNNTSRISRTSARAGELPYMYLPAQQLEPLKAQRPPGEATKHASGLGLALGLVRAPRRGGGRR